MQSQQSERERNDCRHVDLSKDEVCNEHRNPTDR
jgi:hypothetical protein